MDPVKQVRIKNQEEASKVLADLIAEALAPGRNVLWLISGGSSIPVAVAASKLLKSVDTGNLFATLVDDKHGIEPSQTNWQQLVDSGFTLLPPQSQGIIEANKDLSANTESFLKLIEAKQAWADVSIGQFGIGEGYHTGGILAHSLAVSSEELVCGYRENGNNHITITPHFIEQLNYAFINSLGEGKREMVSHFLDSDASLIDEPSQGLKFAKQCLLCSDVLPA